MIGSSNLGVAKGSVSDCFIYWMCSCSNSCSIPRGFSVSVVGSIGGDQTSRPYHNLLLTIILNMLRYRSPPVRFVAFAKLCILWAAWAAADLFFFKSAA